MATDERVGWALSVLKHLPSKNPVTAETVAFYALGLADVSDVELTAAVARAAQVCTFLPTPAELRDIAGVGRVAVDPEPVLARIAAMGSYLPTSGTTYPSVQRVREVLGDGVAEAYSLAGGARVFAGNETTRDIARREFAEALRDVVRVYGAAALGPVEQGKALPAPAYNGPVIYGERPAVSGPRHISGLLPGAAGGGE